MSRTRTTRRIALCAVFLLALAAAITWLFLRFSHREKPVPGARTIPQALREFAPSADPWWLTRFAEAEVPYPPTTILLLAFKREKILRVLASGPDQSLRPITDFPILAASGEEGPKLREGDRQVPEGFYRIELLNPNSRFHLSLRLNYPSPHDLARAKADGRPLDNLGGDIMIHGRAASIGCIAIGDPAIEKLFVLTARTPLDHIRVVILPCDLRTSSANPGSAAPSWTSELHNELASFLSEHGGGL